MGCASVVYVGPGFDVVAEGGLDRADLAGRIGQFDHPRVGATAAMIVSNMSTSYVNLFLHVMSILLTPSIVQRLFT